MHILHTYVNLFHKQKYFQIKNHSKFEKKKSFSEEKHSRATTEEVSMFEWIG